MQTYNLKHLTDDVLLARTQTLVARDRRVTARLLAHLAEIDERKLYASLGYPSMYAYCVHGLGFSEDAAYKRIQVARVGQVHPALFPAISAGRLHMGAVRLLAPHLNASNFEELLGAAGGKTCEQVRELLAHHFPQAETLAFEQILPPVRPIPVPETEARTVPAPEAKPELATWQVRGTVKPLSPQRFDLHVTIGADARGDLDRGRELSGKNVEEVLTAALACYVDHLEKQKSASTDRPVRARPSQAARTIPAAVKRFVWKRDRGACTYRGVKGRVCASRIHLEYDHIVPVAQGGRGTVGNVRLLCRTHNQLEADRRLGKPFMDERRAQASRKPPKSIQVPAPVSRAFS